MTTSFLKGYEEVQSLGNMNPTDGGIKTYLGSSLEGEKNHKWVLNCFPQCEKSNQIYQECQRFASVKHGNISQIREVRIENEGIFLVRSYCDGESLKNLCGNIGLSVIPEDIILTVIEQLCIALRYLHEQMSLPFGGIKSSNIFANPQSLLLNSASNIHITMGSFVPPTLFQTLSKDVLSSCGVLCPPEILDETQTAFTKEADMYSLGGLLFELMNGKAADGAKFLEWESRGPTKYREFMINRFCNRYTITLIDLLCELLTSNPAMRPSAQGVLGVVEKTRQIIQLLKTKQDISNFKMRCYIPDSVKVKPGAKDFQLRIWPTLVHVPSFINNTGSNVTTDTCFLFGGEEYPRSNFLHHIREITLHSYPKGESAVTISAPKSRKRMCTTPKRLSGHRMVYAQRRIFVFGGIQEKNDGHSNDMFIYDVDTLEWSNPKLYGDIPSPREGHCMSVSQDGKKIYIFGGADIYGLKDDLFVYDIETKTFTDLSENAKQKNYAPSKRFYHDSVIIGNLMYIIGGTKSSTQDREFGYIYIYNTKTNSWIEPVEMKSEVYANGGLSEHAAVAVGKKIIIIGGRLSNPPYRRNDITVFDTETMTLEEKPEIVGSIPSRAGLSAACLSNGRIMIVGGDKSISMKEDVNIIHTNYINHVSSLEQHDPLMALKLKIMSQSNKLSDCLVTFG